jgi:hypothetical protein
LGATGFSRHPLAGRIAPVAFAAGVDGANADPDFLAVARAGEFAVVIAHGEFEAGGLIWDGLRTVGDPIFEEK